MLLLDCGAAVAGENDWAVVNAMVIIPVVVILFSLVKVIELE